MYVPSTIRLTYISTLLPKRSHIRVILTPHELHILAWANDRDADAVQVEGWDDAPVHLASRAADLRETAL